MRAPRTSARGGDGSCADEACVARRAFFQQAGRQMLLQPEAGGRDACLVSPHSTQTAWIM